MWDPVQEVPYAHSLDGRWMSFEVGRSMRLKARFSSERGLAGVAAFAVDGDDFAGVCSDPFPMLRAIREGLADAVKEDNEQ